APGVKALTRFFTALEGIPGVRGNFPVNDPNRTVGAAYVQRIILSEEIVERVPNTVIAEAIRAEGARCSPGGYPCHHLSPFWNECDVYGDGKPSRIAFSKRDVRQGPGDCPVAEKINTRLLSVPRMIQYDEEYVDQLATAYRKALTNLDQLEGRTASESITQTRTIVS
ncbi:MAG: hypothetical protein HY321_13145, partial [Armatimonadetes bacterium]|nr:hypothetical protein [Armatimonadota bacterium]